VIDPRDRGMIEAVRLLAGGRGVDVILDPTGGASLAKSCSLLAPLGRLVAYGASTPVRGERRSW
jgi:NADPH2:quinone reductase